MVVCTSFLLKEVNQMRCLVIAVLFRSESSCGSMICIYVCGMELDHLLLVYRSISMHCILEWPRDKMMKIIIDYQRLPQ